MTIEAGTRIGRYEIRRPLGAGGMGQVYAARDTRLDRTVALKLLPAEFASDQKRMQRFVQEARAASSLNHPNIITIHEIEDTASPPFIATEFIDGETLRARLTRPLKLTEALDIITQVASALSAAHAAGIVHRDIKPENIMVRTDGYVKVLDFGLAKLTEPRSAAVIDTEAATRALVNTDPGTVMGTVGYMSPEQARGLPVDARTDLWSLGVVLYEMVAGHLPFTGATPTDTILAIVDKEPLPVAHYFAEAPEALEWIVTKALTKDKDERYQTAREMLTDLRRLKQKVDQSAALERSVAPERLSSAGVGVASSVGQSVQSTVSAAERTTSVRSGEIGAQAANVSSAEYIVRQIKGHKLAATLVAFVVVAIIAGAGLMLYKLKTQRKTEATAQHAMKIMRLTTDGKNGGANISPDGKLVVHKIFTDDGKVSLWVRQVSSNIPVQIAPFAQGDCVGTTFTPDGEHIYYTWFDEQNPLGVLYEVATFGGSPRRVLTHIDGPVTFSPDGHRIAFVRYGVNEESALVTTDTDGGNEQTLVKYDGRTDWLSTDGGSWSPDGREIAIGKGRSAGGKSGMTVVAVPASGGAARTLTEQNWHGVSRVIWLRDNSGLVFAASSDQAFGTQVWYLPLQPESEARRVTNDLNFYGTYSLGVTADNTTLVTVQEDDTSQVWIASAGDDESRARQITTGKYDGFGGLSWTPDGRLVFGRIVGNAADIWIMNADGSQPLQLVNDAASEFAFSVTPDGRYIVFSSNRSGAYHIWRMNLDGSDAKQLTSGEVEDFRPRLSPDGRWIVFNSARTGNFALWRISIDGGEPTLLLDHEADVNGVSPDGRWIACNYWDERGARVALIPFEGGEPARFLDQLPPSPLNRLMTWAADGRTLIYTEQFNVGLGNLWLLPVDGGARKQLTNFKSERISAIAPAPDGKRFALTRYNPTYDVVLFKDFK